MEAPSDVTVELQLQQLGEARNLVLKDPAYWAQVLHGILPLINGPIKDVRRWGADFLAETFSTPVVDARAKQELALAALDTLLRLVNESDTGILKSVVQCSASVYPIIFRHMYVLPLPALPHHPLACPSSCSKAASARFPLPSSPAPGPAARAHGSSRTRPFASFVSSTLPNTNTENMLTKYRWNLFSFAL